MRNSGLLSAPLGTRAGYNIHRSRRPSPVRRLASRLATAKSNRMPKSLPASKRTSQILLDAAVRHSRQADGSTYADVPSPSLSHFEPEAIPFWIKRHPLHYGLKSQLGENPLCFVIEFPNVQFDRRTARFGFAL